MRKHLFTLYNSILCFGIALLFSATFQVYSCKNTPIFVERTEMENEIKIRTASPHQNPDKFCLYKNYILQNEKYKGVYKINNSNLNVRRNLTVLLFDGCIDIALISNKIVVYSAFKLIDIQLSIEFSTIQLAERIKNIFPEIESPYVQWMPNNLNQVITLNGILVGYMFLTFRGMKNYDIFILLYILFGFKAFANSEKIDDTRNTSGEGGSLTKFTVFDNYLDTVDQSSIQTFNFNDVEHTQKCFTISNTLVQV